MAIIPTPSATATAPVIRPAKSLAVSSIATALVTLATGLVATKSPKTAVLSSALATMQMMLKVIGIASKCWLALLRLWRRETRLAGLSRINIGC